MSDGTAERRNGGTGLRGRGLGVLAVALVVPFTGIHAQDQIGIARGSVPQAVTIEDLDGAAVDLGQWMGKTPVVLQFWAIWCPVCEALEPRVRTARAEHGDGVAFLLVAVGVNQSPRSVRRFMEKHPDMGPVVWDGRGRAVRAFEVPGTSYVVGLDASGKVVYTGFGADQDIAGAFAAAAGR